MITDDDIKKMQAVFATKQEMKKEFKKLNKKLDISITFFDRVHVDHEKRIARVEKKLDLPSYAD
jgi:hypothetical protein